MKIRSVFVMGGLLLLGIFLSGCASGTSPTDPPTVSSLPWNTPQPGEGSMMPGGIPLNSDRMH